MLINSILFVTTFFLLGHFVLKKYLFLEKVFFGLIIFYIVLIFSNLLGQSYMGFILLIKIIVLLSFIYFISENYVNLNMKEFKKKINFNNIFLSIFFIIILLENYIDIKLYSLEAGDALAYWYNKTKFFLYNPGLNFFPKADYPNFLSSLWSFSLYNFENDYNSSRIIIPLIFFLGILLVYQKIRLIFADNNIYLNSILFIIILIHFSTYTFGSNYRFSNAGYADGLLSIFLMIGFLYMYSSIISRTFSKQDYFLGLVILGTSSSIKNEGFVISVLVFFMLNFHFYLFFRKKFLENSKILIINFLIFLIIIFIPVLLSIYLESIKIIHSTENISDYINTSNLIKIDMHVDRFYLIMRYFLVNCYYNLEILFPLFLILLNKLSIAFIRSKLFILFLFFSVFFVIYLYSLYIVTAFPFEWHLATSFNRVFFQFIGIFSLFAFLILNYKEKEKL
jgi:hypothetical protein